MKRALHAALATATAGTLLWACFSSPNRFDTRPATLDALAQVVVLPSLEAAVTSTNALVAAVDALHQGPTTGTLAAAQQAWSDARSDWNRCEAFLFGPPRSLLIPFRIDDGPVDTRIELQIAGAAILDQAHVASLGTKLRGFHAVEYLLFDPVAGDAVLLGSDLDAERRRDYALAAAQDLAASIALILEIWDPSGDDFATTFASAGMGSAEYPTVDDALDDVVNQLIFLTELVADVRLGAPLGFKTGSPDPSLVESGRSGRSRQDILDDLAGIEDLYFGRFGGVSGPSLDAIVEAVAPPVARDVRSAIALAIADVEAIPEPLSSAVTNQSAVVAQARTSVKRLNTVIAVEMAGVLGTTINFSDFDGD